MLEIPLYAGFGIAAGYALLAAWAMNQIAATLPMGSTETGGVFRMVMTVMPFQVLIFCGLSVSIASDGHDEILGLLLASMGSMALLIPLCFSRAMTWFGRERMTAEMFTTALILAVLPMSTVMFAFLGLFLFDPWPAWHVASIMVGGLVAPALIVYAMPSAEIPLTEMTDEDGKTFETNFHLVLIRLVPLEFPILIWFVLGFVMN